MKYRKTLEPLSLTCLLAIAVSGAPAAQEVRVDVTRAKAIEENTDHGVCGIFCPWWAKQDFWVNVKFTYDGSEANSVEVSQRDDAWFSPAFTALGPLEPMARFVPLEVYLWDDDTDNSVPDPDQQFDHAQLAGRTLNLQFDACLGVWNDTTSWYGPVPAPDGDDPGTPPRTVRHVRGFESDPANIWLGVSRIGNIPLIPDDVDITGSTPVQVVEDPSSIVANKPTVFKVELGSSWTMPVTATIRVTATDGFSLFVDELPNVTVPPGESTWWLFENSPFLPQKFPNDPFLNWVTEIEVPGEVTCVQDLFPELTNWGCCNLENNTKNTAAFGTGKPVVVTRNPLTLYVAYNLNTSAPDDLPTDAEMQANFDFNEAFRAATFPIAPPLNSFRVPARFVIRDDPDCAGPVCLEPYASAYRWSLAARMAGIDTLVLTTAPNWISRLGPSAAPWLDDFGASGVTLAEFSPNAVVSEAEETTVTTHEIAHTFRLSQRPCTPTVPELALLETIFPTLGCRDEYLHTAPPRPFRASGYDVEGNVYPAGFSWDGGTWDDLGAFPACSPVTPGSREIKCAMNIMDRSTGPGNLRTWIDDESYDWLTGELRDIMDPPLVSVRGLLGTAGGWSADPLTFNGTLDPSYLFDGIPDMPEAPPGGESGAGFFSIVLEGPNGNRTYRFDPAFQADGSKRMDVSFFTVTIPWDPATTRISLWGPGDAHDPDNAQQLELAAIDRSAASPTIGSLLAGRNGPAQITPVPEPPNIGPGDTVHLSWDASDLDSTALWAALDLQLPAVQQQGEYNGRIPLAVDLETSSFQIPHQAFDWRPGLYGGRVTVSDGVNTATLENPTLFSLCVETNGGVESCDGVDNDCNGVVDDLGGPPLEGGFQVGRSELSWATVAGATYDVVGGSLSGLRSTNGDFATATTACLGEDLPGPNLPYSAQPGNPGEVEWYLVRSFGCGTSGSWDGGGVAQVAPRDDGIDASNVSCSSCAHTRCVEGVALDATCDTCVAQVCAADSFCCSNQWDSICVEEVRTVCGLLSCPEAAGSCAHTVCEEGGALTAGCDDPPVSPSCVTQICGGDPFCCNTAWDNLCVDQVTSVCQAGC